MVSELAPLGVRLDECSFYGDASCSSNVLLIGRKAREDDSGTILEGLHGEYSCTFPDGDHYYFTYNDEKRGCHDKARDGKSYVEIDHGIIVRTKLNDKEILLLAGIHMHGTLAAAEVALSQVFQKKVMKSGFSYFAQLVRVRVHKNGLAILEPEWHDEFPLCEIEIT